MKILSRHLSSILATTLLLLVFVPLMTFAQVDQPEDVGDFFSQITAFITDTLVPFIFALAFIVFLWGVFQYFILGGADETKREGGKSLMLWGIIGFVLMVSIWGIVTLISEGLGLDEENLSETLIPDAPEGN